jgi:putrescine transport system ATP-binding protein
MVTHDQEEAMSMATRVAVMDKGRIAQIGPPREVYERPASRFVADFLGAVNLFAGRVTSVANGLCHIESDEAGAPLTVAHDGTPAKGGTVAVAVRPEKIALATEPQGGDNMLSGTVDSISYRGEASTYRVTLPTGKVVRVTIANRGRQESPIVAGSAVRLAWSAEAALLLEE